MKIYEKDCDFSENETKERDTSLRSGGMEDLSLYLYKDISSGGKGSSRILILIETDFA